MERVTLSVESTEKGIVLEMKDVDSIKQIKIIRKNNRLEIIQVEHLTREEIKECLKIARKILLGPNYYDGGGD